MHADKLVGLFLARPVIGRVEVLEAKITSLPITASVFLITSALTSGRSKTASMIRSTSFRSSKLSVGVIRAMKASAFSLVILPRDTFLSTIFWL